MKLYDCTPAPSPRRVRVFLAEKGVTLPTRQVDLANREQLTAEFRALNPRCTVPVLELDDGTCLVETLAICHYLEQRYPAPPLMGRELREQALVLQWNARLEAEGLAPIAEAFRNRSRGFVDRALTGPQDFRQIPELAERGLVRATAFMDMLDERLADSPYIVGGHFSMADITALVAVDFARWISLDPGERRHLARWHRSVSSRPSAAS